MKIIMGVLLLCAAVAGIPAFIKATLQHAGPGGDPYEWTGRAMALVLVAGGGIALIVMGSRRKVAQVSVRR
jgi:hypothetical protein